MSNAAREDLHAESDPYAGLNTVDPFVDMADNERARLHASLQRAEEEIASGGSTLPTLTRRAQNPSPGPNSSPSDSRPPTPSQAIIHRPMKKRPFLTRTPPTAGNATAVGDPAIRDHIFDPFFTTRPVGLERGTGLGLAICQAIAIAHGGTLTFESEVGKRSTFRLELPAAPAEE